MALSPMALRVSAHKAASIRTTEAACDQCHSSIKQTPLGQWIHDLRDEITAGCLQPISPARLQ